MAIDRRSRQSRQALSKPFLPNKGTRLPETGTGHNVGILQNEPEIKSMLKNICNVQEVVGKVGKIMITTRILQDMISDHPTNKT